MSNKSLKSHCASKACEYVSIKYLQHLIHPHLDFKCRLRLEQRELWLLLGKELFVLVKADQRWCQILADTSFETIPSTLHSTNPAQSVGHNACCHRFFLLLRQVEYFSIPHKILWFKLHIPHPNKIPEVICCLYSFWGLLHIGSCLISTSHRIHLV